MAQLQVVRHERGGYAAGDILHAFSTSRLEALHAECLCVPRVERFLPSGFANDPMGLMQLWYERTRPYRFERRGPQTVVQVTLADLSETDVSSQIRVEAFLARRFATARAPGAAGRPIFGAPGAEIWYGGPIRYPAAALDAVWTALEAQTTHRRADHQTAPNVDQRKYLLLTVDDFDEDTSVALTAPWVNPSGQMLAKRRARVRFQTLPQFSADERVALASRNWVEIPRPFLRSDIVSMRG